MLSVEFASGAKKFLKKADKMIINRIIEKIEKLRIDPFPPDMKRVIGKKDRIFRVRVGHYRIQYSIFHDKKVIFISYIDKRERAYNK